jgi:hypothetical protein
MKGNAICFCSHRKYCHCKGFDRSEQIVPPFSPLLPQPAVGQTMSWIGTPEAGFRRRQGWRWPQRQHRRPVPLWRHSVLRPAVPMATVVLLRGPAVAFSRKTPALVASVITALVEAPVVVAVVEGVMLLARPVASEVFVRPPAHSPASASASRAFFLLSRSLRPGVAVIGFPWRAFFGPL